MKRYLTAAFLCVAAFAFLPWRCTNETPETGPLIFYVMGDWGRKGSPDQVAVAEQMERWTSIENPRFIVATGDNFYPTGVTSTTDPHWQESFEKVYNGMNMKTKPWYVALGNHDYDGNPEAEISYHNKNLKWNMPARYYTRIERIGDGGSARLIFVDTTPFERSSSQDTTRQKSWLDSLSARNDTDWVFVIGHHQVYSGGLRKFDRSPIRYAFEPIFNKNGVDIYFCGHEHDLQHMKVAGKPTHYFLSGAGSDIRSTGMMEHSLFAASVQGFMSVTVKKQTLEVKVIDHNGNMLYSTTLEH